MKKIFFKNKLKTSVGNKNIFFVRRRYVVVKYVYINMNVSTYMKNKNNYCDKKFIFVSQLVILFVGFSYI